MPKINKDWCEQVMFVDGGSTDGSIEWAIENGYEVYVQNKKGLRHAYNEVWDKIKGDIVSILLHAPEDCELFQE